MKVDSFKEVLLKKANNSNLQALIKYMDNDILVSYVVEALEKMAEIKSKKKPNSAVIHYAKESNQFDSHLIHDALSHHASRYKTALKAGNIHLADSHMKKIFNLVHFVKKMQADALNDHTKGNIRIDAIDPKPWERNHYLKLKPTGEFRTVPSGWARSLNDYSWLRKEPHGSFEKETNIHGHKGAYPLEEMRVNGKYLDIRDDVDVSKGHVSHIMDTHPIMSVYDTPSERFLEDKKAKYIQDHENFMDNDEIGNILDRRSHDIGSKKPEPVHAHLNITPNQPSSKTSSMSIRDRLNQIMGSSSGDSSDLPPPIPQEAMREQKQDKPTTKLSGGSQVPIEEVIARMNANKNKR